MIKKILSNVGEYKKYAILTPIVMIGEVLMEVLIPLLTAKIIDEGIQKSNVSLTVRYGLILVAMAVVSLAFGALGGALASKAGVGFAKNLRKKLFDRVQDFSFSNVDKFSTASLVTRLTTDVTNIQNIFMMLLRMAVRSPFMLIGATIMAVSMNARLAAIFLVAVPVLALVIFLIIKKAYPLFMKMLKKYDKLNLDVQENLISMRVCKAFVREDYEKEKFDDSANKVRLAQLAAEKLVILNMPAMMLTMYGCIIAVLWFGGKMVMGGTFEVGQLSGFLSYIMQILSSLMMLSMIFISFVVSRASLERISEVLDEKIDIDDTNASPDLKLKDGSIEFKNVCFSYANDKNNLTLSNVSFKIPSGSTVGVIGGTGSSKSTLVQLIPRLYDAMSGEVIVGGENVKKYKLDNLRNDVSVVLQKNVLFSGTIKDNLRWGNQSATDEQIEEACKNAQAHDFITAFPDGYNMQLGQGGVNVSGGQKQRLCIARALLKKPKIVILDDSTSAVDTATDAKIRNALKTKLNDTTTIIIAQRISSVCDADLIIVLDDGKISDIGTHDELMKTSEIYIDVYNSQKKGDKE